MPYPCISASSMTIRIQFFPLRASLIRVNPCYPCSVFPADIACDSIRVVPCYPCSVFPLCASLFRVNPCFPCYPCSVFSATRQPYPCKSVLSVFCLSPADIACDSIRVVPCYPCSAFIHLSCPVVYTPNFGRYTLARVLSWLPLFSCCHRSVPVP